MKKTNVARLLDKMKIPYEIIKYEVDENDLSAENVATKIGLPLEQVFKTLVARGDRTGVLVSCIPGEKELDLKALAMLSGNKKVEMVHLKDVLSLTGYIRGGVSPLGMKKNYPIFLDESALKYENISISAGLRGYQIWFDPNSLLTAVNAKIGNLSK